MQRMEQIKLDKQAMEAKLGTMQKDIEEKKMKKKQESYVQNQGKQCKARESGPIATVDCSTEEFKKTYS